MLSLMDHHLRQACEGTATTIGLEVEVKEFWYFPPTPFHPDLVAAVRDAAAAQGYNLTKQASSADYEISGGAAISHRSY